MRPWLVLLAAATAAPLAAQTSAAPALDRVPTASASGAIAGDTTYTPRLPKSVRGRQLYVVYLGAKGCGHSRDAELVAAVRHLKGLARDQADRRQQPFAVAGVALDARVGDGLAYLASLGEFDEVATGSGFRNMAAVERVWRAPEGLPAIPQVLVYERTLTERNDPYGDSWIDYTPDRLVGRHLGTDAILAWVARGAPVDDPGQRDLKHPGKVPAAAPAASGATGQRTPPGA